MDKHAVTPGAVAPAREMLGQLLLEQKQPQQALEAFEAVLKVAPKRFNALYGAGSAADAAGNQGSGVKNASMPLAKKVARPPQFPLTRLAGSRNSVG